MTDVCSRHGVPTPQGTLLQNVYNSSSRCHRVNMTPQARFVFPTAHSQTGREDFITKNCFVSDPFKGKKQTATCARRGKTAQFVLYSDIDPSTQNR